MYRSTAEDGGKGAGGPVQQQRQRGLRVELFGQHPQQYSSRSFLGTRHSSNRHPGQGQLFSLQGANLHTKPPPSAASQQTATLQQQYSNLYRSGVSGGGGSWSTRVCVFSVFECTCLSNSTDLNSSVPSICPNGTVSTHGAELRSDGARWLTCSQKAWTSWSSTSITCRNDTVRRHDIMRRSLRSCVPSSLRSVRSKTVLRSTRREVSFNLFLAKCSRSAYSPALMFLRSAPPCGARAALAESAVNERVMLA